MSAPQPATGRRPSWGVALVVLLAVNIVADLVLGRHGITGLEALVLVVLWGAFWILVVLTLLSAIRNRPRH